MLRRHAMVPRHRLESAGFTLVEVSVSIAVLVLGVLGMLASVTTGDRLILENRETRQAFVAAQTMFAELQAQPIETVFQRYNGTNADDPGGVTSPGSTFTACGLARFTTDGGEASGVLRFPSSNGNQLREDLDDPTLGMPRDLDGDGVISHAPLTKTPLVLPVAISVRWQTSKGPREVEVRKFLFGGG